MQRDTETPSPDRPPMAEDGPTDSRGLTQGPQTNGEKQTTVFVR